MIAPEDNLPPVQPPTAGFLMQLFIVPLVIVVVIVLVCLMFNWLAHLGTRPQDLVSDLAKLNAGSWQKALTIANLLTDRRQAELRRDPRIARQLADILDQQLDRGDTSAERIKLRIYLCSALGVMEVDDGLAELIRAAGQERELAEIEVRKTAIESLARRADQSADRRREFQQHRELLSVLQRAARQSSDQPKRRELEEQLRLRAAYALGVIGGDSALDTLAQRLSDIEPTVRYNAATGLARHGDLRAVPRLIEMLEVSSSGKLADPLLDDLAATTIIQNALRAIVQLAEANPDANLDQLKQAIEILNTDARLNATVRRGIEVDAKAALLKLAPRAARQRDSGSPLAA
jgi:hypothetical protein